MTSLFLFPSAIGRPSRRGMVVARGSCGPADPAAYQTEQEMSIGSHDRSITVQAHLLIQTNNITTNQRTGCTMLSEQLMQSVK